MFKKITPSLNLKVFDKKEKQSFMSSIEEQETLNKIYSRKQLFWGETPITSRIHGVEFTYTYRELFWLDNTFFPSKVKIPSLNKKLSEKELPILTRNSFIDTHRPQPTQSIDIEYLGKVFTINIDEQNSFDDQCLSSHYITLQNILSAVKARNFNVAESAYNKALQAEEDHIKQ